MSDPAPKPLKLPVESDNLPPLDDVVVEAICIEHKHSILQFAQTLLECKWTPEQITHVAASWPWSWLARAVGAERIKLGREPVAVALVEKLRAEGGPTASPRSSLQPPKITPKLPPGVG